MNPGSGPEVRASPVVDPGPANLRPVGDYIQEFAKRGIRV